MDETNGYTTPEFDREMALAAWLDKIVDAKTAFFTFEAMAAELRKGYVPTLSVRDRRGRILVKALTGLGWKVWVPRW